MGFLCFKRVLRQFVNNSLVLSTFKKTKIKDIFILNLLIILFISVFYILERCLYCLLFYCVVIAVVFLNFIAVFSKVFS